VGPDRPLWCQNKGQKRLNFQARADLSPPSISTIFSTSVEKSPREAAGVFHRGQTTIALAGAHEYEKLTVGGRTVSMGSSVICGQGYLNEAHIPAERTSSQEDPRVPIPHEDQGRPAGAGAPPREGPQAPYRVGRVAGRGGAVTAGGSSRCAADRATRPDERFRPEERIRRRADYVAVYDGGRRIGGRLMTVFLLENGRERPRLGIAATRKYGSSVQRNRAKRLVREAFRRHKLPLGLDIVVIPRREMLGEGFGRVEADYLAALERRTRRPREA
jgi:ribonuclease P protein component